MPDEPALPDPDQVLQSIVIVRGQKVMLDAALAALYDVDTKALVRAVKRNIARFPDDFMFRLSEREHHEVRSDEVGEHGGRRYPPYAFTEQGVAMLSSVLRSPRAVAVNVEIMRAFVRLRQVLASHAELASRLDGLEAKYDSQFSVVFDAIRQLMTSPSQPRKQVGFVPPADPPA